MSRLLGYYGGKGISEAIAIDSDSPLHRAIERAVNSYDPSKGWKFNTYLRQCLWWENFSDIKKMLGEKKEQGRIVTAVDMHGSLKDVFEYIDRSTLPAERETIVSHGVHTISPEESLLSQREKVDNWLARQEERIANYLGEDPEDHERQSLSFVAINELHKIKTPQQAELFIVHWQSEGGDGFIEPLDDKPKEQPKLSESDKKSWLSMLKKHPLLTSKERAALILIAPGGDLQNMRSFSEVAGDLSEKYPKEFPGKVTENDIVNLFMNAHYKLAGAREFEEMQDKLSPILKAITQDENDKINTLSLAINILQKAKKGTRVSGHKYWKREGTPGGYKYYYQDEIGNIIRGTNAPEDHSHHDKKLGSPEIHKEEPDPISNPEYFDPKTGRKMHRAIPPHAEWNPDYNQETPLKLWAARWKDNPQDPEPNYGYYHSDYKGRQEFKFNISNKEFDVQLPKVRKLYKNLLKSDQLHNKALGLMIAILDQAAPRAGKKIYEVRSGTLGLCSIKVANAKIKGNTVTIDYPGKAGVDQQQTIVLDRHNLDIMKELISSPRKKDKDYLFSVPVMAGDRIKFREIGYNKLYRILQTVGVTPKQFRTYHGTRIYSERFGQILNKVTERITPKILDKVSNEAALDVAKALGHYIKKGEDRKLHVDTAFKSYIDPIVVQTLYLNALNQDVKKAVEHDVEYGKYDGLKIGIENEKGSTRHWHDPNNDSDGKTKMHYDYGYIVGTKGTDGEEVDVYIGPHHNCEKVFVVHQLKAPDFKKYDEDKVMFGFRSDDEAKKAYLKQYNDPRFFGNMTELSMEEFKKKVKSKMIRGKMIKGFWELAKANGEHQLEPRPTYKLGNHVTLTKDMLNDKLNNGHYSMISAGRNVDHPDEKNLPENHPMFSERHEKLRQDLVNHGLDHTEIEGHYGGKEKTFIVHHNKKPENNKAFMVHHEHPSEHTIVRDLGKKYNQNSVIHSHKGTHELHFVTGQDAGNHHKGQGHEITPHASDYYSKVEHPEGSATKFSLNFDLNKKHDIGSAILKALSDNGTLDNDFDDDIPIVHQVVSNPHDRSPDEEDFSHWLHTHPLHEGEHDWNVARAIHGIKDTHKPVGEEEEYDDIDDERHVENAYKKHVRDQKMNDYYDRYVNNKNDNQLEDYSYLNEWGS